MAVGDSEIRITASCGVSGFPGLPVSGPEALFRSADEALYRAKREGRNPICLFPASGSPSLPASVGQQV
jgi:PleD family two-component response regulator